jgi:putative spermidine/putrescine transport system permease protein
MAGGGRIVPWLWLLPSGAILIPFFLIPIVVTIRNSFDLDDPMGMLVPALVFVNYAKVLSDPYYLGVFGHTLISAAVVALAALVIAYPFAWLLARATPTARALLLWAVYLPVYVSVIMRVFGWIVIISDSGLINEALLRLKIIDHPIEMINEISGLMIGLLHRYLPLMILPLMTSLQKIDESVLRASANLGGTRWFTWSRVVMPMSLPGAIAGVLPMLMGSPRFQLLAPAIYYEATTNASWALSGAMATVVIAAVALFLLTANLFLRRMAPWASL